MNEKDKWILRLLSRNSRETLTIISRKTGIAISTIFDRLKEIEQDLGLRYTIKITKIDKLTQTEIKEFKRYIKEGDSE